MELVDFNDFSKIKDCMVERQEEKWGLLIMAKIIF